VARKRTGLKPGHYKNAEEESPQRQERAVASDGWRVARKERIKRRRSPQLTVHSRQLKEQEGRKRFNTESTEDRGDAEATEKKGEPRIA
jgi:hypothetical protein